MRIYSWLGMGIMLILGMAYNTLRKDINAKHFGARISAVVVVSPSKCGLISNKIEVLYNEKMLPVLIGRNDCKQGKYQPGAEMQFWYSKRHDKLITLDSFPEYSIPIWILGFLAALFAFRIDKKQSS